MGLAPYGEPRYADLISNELMNIADDGSFQLDMSYFNYATGLTMTNEKFHSLFGAPPRIPETQISQREMDIAASIQKVAGDVVIRIAKNIANQTGNKNLCLAGGVALNCVANGKLLRENLFENVWIQPAGDAGGALGAALSVWHLHLKNERVLSLDRDAMKGAFLGPKFSDIEIETELNACGAVYKKYKQDDLIDQTVDALIEQKAIGWMQGRMEFGPRALGGRSIIADARSDIMQKQLNLKVKYRESFMPFAPSILREDVKEWFSHETDSPYMLLVSEVKNNKRRKKTTKAEPLFGLDKLNEPRSSVPAITHVDYSARIQTVHSDTNPRYHALIKKFKEKTGCPLIVNTSFNAVSQLFVRPLMHLSASWEPS